jgi:hypothetical protein
MRPEIWKDIVGYEGYYRISNNGRVLSVARLLKRRHQSAFYLKETMLALHKRGDYLFIALSKEAIRQQESIHVLVAKHFVDNPYNRAEVNHEDGNKLNNCDWNLKWVTHQENIDHSIATGLKPKAIGIRVVAFRDGKKIGEYESYHEVLEKLGVDPGHVCRILQGKLRTSKGYSFKRA